MEAKESPIRLLNFMVVRMEYKFIPPAKKSMAKSPDSFFKDYEIDIDFSNNAVDEEQFYVFAKIEVNNSGKPKPGYKIFIEGGARFLIPKQTEGEEKVINNLRFFSSVNIVVGYLRAAISTMTASAPMGPYLLPPVDMQDLFRRKSQNTTDEGQPSSAK